MEAGKEIGVRITWSDGWKTSIEQKVKGTWKKGSVIVGHAPGTDWTDKPTNTFKIVKLSEAVPNEVVSIELKAEPEPEPIVDNGKAPYALKGDRLGMSLQAFKAKYRRTFNAGKPYEAPFCRDDVEPWHRKANIITASVTFPFEDYQDGTHTPKLAGVKDRRA
jgi:hypothetical protein